eukprot:GHUV01034899.1.p1 GENE.GHUV01034899.1~~GHUV01034899.1.p1  ORF type:complete len:450 (+),score=126.46 GHUV01034899.1:608-1957(+)
MCGEQPNQYNSQPDSLGRLWGVWWGNSCAFRTDKGAPVYYDGYTGKQYSGGSSQAPSPSPPPSPAAPTAQPTPKSSPAASPPASSSPAIPKFTANPPPTAPAASPPPAPASTSSSTAMASPAVSPSPTPASKVLPTAMPPAPAASTDSTCPCASASATPVIILNATAVAEAVAQRLWRMFSDYTNGYEMVVSEAPATTGTASNVTHATLSPVKPPARSSAAQQTQVAALLASLLSAAPQQQTNSSHSPLATLQAALAAGAQSPAASPAPSPASSVMVAASANSGSNRRPVPTQSGGNSGARDSTNSSSTYISSNTAINTKPTNSSSTPTTVSTRPLATLPSTEGDGSIELQPTSPASVSGTVTAAVPAATATRPAPANSPTAVQQRPTTINTFSPGGGFLRVPGDESALTNTSTINSSKPDQGAKSGTPVLDIVHNAVSLPWLCHRTAA